MSGSGSGMWSGMGAPCGEMVTAKSPWPVIYAPDPPRTPTPAPPAHPNHKHHKHVQFTDLQLQEVSVLLRHPHPPPGLLWTGQEPGLTQLPYHTTPSPCPGSGKKPLEDLRVSSLRAWPHREREGWRTPTTWPEDLGGGVAEAQGAHLLEPVTPVCAPPPG